MVNCIRRNIIYQDILMYCSYSVLIASKIWTLSVIKSMTMFRLSWWFLALLLMGYFIGDYYNLHVSLFALGGALIFLGIANHFKATNPWMTVKSAPWQIVWFSIWLYIVVFGLKNAGLNYCLYFVLFYSWVFIAACYLCKRILTIFSFLVHANVRFILAW